MPGQMQVAGVRVCLQAPGQRSHRPDGTGRFLYDGPRVNQTEHMVHDRGGGRRRTLSEPLDRPLYGGRVLAAVMELGYRPYQAGGLAIGGLAILPALAGGPVGRSVSYLAHGCP